MRAERCDYKRPAYRIGPRHVPVPVYPPAQGELLKDVVGPERQGAPLLLLQSLIGPGLAGRHGLERLLWDEAPEEPWGELGLDLCELRLRHLHALTLEDAAGLVGPVSVPDDASLQLLGDQ